MSKARAFLSSMSAAFCNSATSQITQQPPLIYKIIATCSTTKARVGVMTLRHGDVDTPVFMPVGTQVTQSIIL